MTFLHKLVIKGVRSYNPNKAQTIDFQHPLTLIVGQNGTGKTTLIECLKYITTGTLPPNSKGGAFIYDGGLANNTEVKAEIKLYLHNFYDKEIVIQKIIQTSIKQKKTEQKILEFNVWVNNNPKEIIDFDNTLRSSCGKINKDDLSSILEINTSILENIIFCHQEDTMWYLAEPATIKKKFDEIFSSTRYSKILENLKKAKKEIATKSKVIDTEMSYLLKARDKKFEIENKCATLKEDLEKKICNISALEKNEKDCTSILANLNTEQGKINIIVEKKKEISNFKNLSKITYTEDECNNLFKTIDIDAINNQIIDLEKQIKNQEQEIQSIEKNKQIYEQKQQEVNKLETEKIQILNALQTCSENISVLEKWLNDQKDRFQTKIKLGLQNVKSDDYKNIFELFFKSYDQELNKKIKVVADLKNQCDKYYLELEENRKKIKSLEHLKNFKYEEKDYFEIENLDEILKKLENEYEKAVSLTREMIINEEKINKRDSILKLLRNKTKLKEIDNVKTNIEKIKNTKIEIRKNDKLLNELESLIILITSKFENYNDKIYDNVSCLSHNTEDTVYLDLNIAHRILDISNKNYRCFLCERSIESMDKYKSKLINLSNNEALRKHKISENNYNVKKEILSRIQQFNEKTNNKFMLKLFSTDKMQDFCVYVTELLDNLQNYKTSIKNEINDFELSIIDFEEEVNICKNNINLFNEIENLDIKPISCAKLEDIQKNIKKYKTCKEIKNVKMQMNYLDELISRNNVLEKKYEDKKTECKNKNEKMEALKTSIFKKKLEVDYKLNDFYSKKQNYLELTEKHNKLSHKLNILTENFKEFNPNMLSEKIEHNQKNKNLMFRLKDELNNKKQILSSVNEHLTYYKSLNKFKKIENEIKLLEETLKSKFNLDINTSSNVVLEYLTSLESKIKTMKTKYDKLLENKNILKGEISQLRNQIKSYEVELQTEYKDVVHIYNKKYVENKIIELSCNDIDKCITVLDKSIIDYHYNKIEEINLNLKELWSNCYKGNDIDYIKLIINENGSKNYSYKMMIVKNNIELDMRNRSSAGQKMIGNILLRMALSRVFCCNFNVLTLDEPTTNLDKENVESLAYTLVNITKTNPNLQLIIITHDEDFLSIMCRESLSFYYRLTRNVNGDSVIIKETA